MRGAIALTLVLVVLLSSRPAQSGAWSLGSHMGLAHISSGVEGSGSSFSIAGPQSAFVYQPGLRLGFGDERRMQEVQLDVGFFWLDQAGASYSLLDLSTSYQRCLSGGSTAPFANLGLGLLSEGSAGRSSASGLFGLGVGVRHVIRERRGAVRAEGRVDWLLRDKTTDRPALTTIGLRLGFDLWL